MIALRARESFWAALAAFSFTFLVWTPSLSGAFSKDDLSNIVGNPAMTQPAEWPRFFYDSRAATTDPSLRDTYRPLASLSYALTSFFFKTNPFFFHLADIVGHSANAAFVLLLGWEMSASLPAAAAGAAWFSLHPAQAEGVSYISGAHPSVFSLLFIFVALRLHRQGRGTPAIACFCAASLFKESAVAFAPLFALALGEAPHRRLWKKNIRENFSYFAVALAVLAARLPVLGGLGQYGPYLGSWSAQAHFALNGVTSLVRNAFWPYGQSVCYSLSGSACTMNSLVGAGLLAAWGSAAFLAWRRQGPWLIALCWPAAALLTVSNIAPRPILAADRFLYAALPGVAWAAALALRRWPKAAAAVAALVIAWLAPRCLERQQAWRNNFSVDLASYQATDDPCTAVVLGTDYFNFRDFAQASLLAQEGLTRHPSPPVEASLKRIRDLSSKFRP